MIEKTLATIKKIIPTSLFRKAQPAYHFLMALAGALWYRFPSRRLTVIAVTGTKGKTTTTELIYNMLTNAGYKTSLQNTIHFIHDKKETRNLYKMSMPGRFFMQRFFHDAIKAGCTHAVIEATSEGSKFFRHRFIAMDSLVFTNLSPEHIEAHGSFENYREAKVDIARQLKRGKKKRTVLVVNGEDEASQYFLEQEATEKYRFYLHDADPFTLGSKTTTFTWRENTCTTSLIGEFNLKNIIAACTVCEAFGADEQKMLEGVANTKEVRGRVQKIDVGQPFEVVVDYAHTVDSLEALYKAFPRKKIIALLGNTGGGRDTWKRPEMAKIAAKHASSVYLTNEDPYDEDPMQIIKQMARAIEDSKPHCILDRREAIASAIKEAHAMTKESAEPVCILISGKGTDPYIMEANGKKTPWSDADVAREELEKVFK